jgi:predicted amidophosphoribosyltransferase
VVERAGPPSACHWCSEPLPRREVLNFCPFCGGNVHTAPCSNCGEELEVEWKFCVACGTSVGERG